MGARVSRIYTGALPEIPIEYGSEANTAAVESLMGEAQRDLIYAYVAAREALERAVGDDRERIAKVCAAMEAALASMGVDHRSDQTIADCLSK